MNQGSETDLWMAFLDEVKRRGASIAVVSGKLSKSSCRNYQRMQWLLGPMLQSIDLIGAQNELYYERYLKVGITPDKLKVTTNLKFAGLADGPTEMEIAECKRLIGWQPGQLVITAGSTHDPEEKHILSPFH